MPYIVLSYQQCRYRFIVGFLIAIHVRDYALNFAARMPIVFVSPLFYSVLMNGAEIMPLLLKANAGTKPQIEISQERKK
jgi:hypothetical protein